MRRPGPHSRSDVFLAIFGLFDSLLLGYEGLLSEAQVRLLGPKGDTLARLTTRMPSQWKEDAGYAAWDEMIAPGADLKASYKLATDWEQIDTKMGASSFGAAFLIEADIEIGSSTTTTRSGQLTRQPTEMIDT